MFAIAEARIRYGVERTHLSLACLRLVGAVLGGTWPLSGRRGPSPDGTDMRESERRVVRDD